MTPACTHACTLVYLLYKEPSITHFSTHELPSPISFFFARRITPIWRPKVIKKVTKMVTQTMCMTFPCGEQNHTHGPGWPKVPRRQGQGPPRSPASRDRDHLGRPRGVKMTQKVVQMVSRMVNMKFRIIILSVWRISRTHHISKIMNLLDKLHNKWSNSAPNQRSDTHAYKSGASVCVSVSRASERVRGRMAST